MWPLRIAASRLRPLNAGRLFHAIVVLLLVAAFLWGDFVLFRRLFHATKQVEATTPIFALGLLRNLLALVFLVATVVLFSSSMTTAIGSFFTDLDLDLYHAAPISKLRIVFARWLKTLVQSATVVYAFVVPLFVAFAEVYDRPPWTFYPAVLVNLALLLTIPVSLASTLIVALVRWFPVRRVHQIVATLAIIVLTMVVVAFRMSRPERFFTQISTDDVITVLRAIELPSMDVYPGTALADQMTGWRKGLPWKIWIPSAALLGVFLAFARSVYFAAFVRARESMAPVAIGSAWITRLLDRLFAHRSAPVRALIGKEIRMLGRDVAQWSQVFLMAALMFIYLYNIRMLPLAGDTRAAVVAYANLGMAGFVVAAVCLRFAYPSVSSEGKAFWLLQSSPVSYRQFIRVKVLVYATPLTIVALLLTAFANVMLGANAIVWSFTLFGASLLAFTLVSLGVGMGALAPNFNAENPLQVGLSLGGFAYMSISLLYVGFMMFVMARPIMRLLFAHVFGIRGEQAWVGAAIAVVTALTVSILLAVIPLVAAERALTRLGESD